MSLAPVETGEVLTEDEYLEVLASRIRSEYRRSREAMGEAVDAYFAIGQCLVEARDAIASDPAFGQWFKAQEFGFTSQWARVLRSAAENEGALRPVLQSQLASSGRVNIEKAVQQVRSELNGSTDSSPTERRRSPLPDAAAKAGWELRKAIERVERIVADDRFPSNREQVAAGLRSHLSYVAEVVPDLVGAMHQPQED